MERWGIGDQDLTDLTEESVGLLSRLLQADTTNPPGNETRAALVLQDYFASQGLACELVGDLPDRQNLVVRLAGSRPGPTLCLLGHTDVVPAEPDEWTLPPFAGEVRDGWVWGRGATDMKNQVAAQAVAIARLARGGADFAGDVLYVATADEEVGDYCGARWLVQNRLDLVRCDYLLNEGGGWFSWSDGVRVHPLTVGEKAFAQFRITARGKGGHGSIPLHERNAVELLARIICALADHELPVIVSPFSAAYIDRLIADPGLRARLKDPASARRAVADLHRIDAELAYLIEPLLGITFSPTIARAGGQAVNVIPSHAQIDIDCRMLPEQSIEDVRAQVDLALAAFGGRYDFEWIDVTEGNESPPVTVLSAAIDRTMQALVPGAVIVPLHLCGFTDSRWFREYLPDVVAYGFCPFAAEDTETMGGREHAKDERIHVDDVPLQVLFFERLVRELLI